MAMYINWTKDVFIDPVTLTAGPGPNGIPIPTYGNYGGPDYTDGSIGGTIPLGGGVAPVDQLDALFKAHDLAYQNSGATEDPSADLAVIHGIEYLTATHQLDAEASFYGGAAIFGRRRFHGPLRASTFSVGTLFSGCNCAVRHSVWIEPPQFY